MTQLILNVVGKLRILYHFNGMCLVIRQVSFPVKHAELLALKFKKVAWIMMMKLLYLEREMFVYCVVNEVQMLFLYIKAKNVIPL